MSGFEDNFFENTDDNPFNVSILSLINIVTS